MKKKIIGIFVDSKKISGGAYQELLYNIDELEKNGGNYEYKIIFSSKNLKIDTSNINVSFSYLNIGLLDRYICYLRNFGNLTRRLKNIFFFKNKFEEFLKKNLIDLVYFTGPSQYSLYLENTKYFITVPDVMFREFNELPEFVDNGEFVRKNEILTKSLPRAVKVITNAKIIKDKIINFFNVEEKRIILINHRPSLSVQNFNKPNQNTLKEIRNKYDLPKKYIFYPSMYLPHKNHKTIIDVIHEVKKNFKKNLDVVFCGNDIGYLKKIKDYSKEKNVFDQFKFLGFVEDETLPYLYFDSHLVLMTHISGPTMIPPWEAFKMQKPVIFPNLEGIKEVLSDSVCYADPFDVSEISEKVVQLYESDELIKEYIKKGSAKYIELQEANEFRKIIKEFDNFFKIRSLWDYEDY